MMKKYHVPATFTQLTSEDQQSGRQLHTLQHSSGLLLKYLPFPGFAEKFSALTVPFGAIHASFQVAGKDHHLPAGTAHFLEHCAFLQNDAGGLTDKLARLGANANAYTTYDHTLYFFKTVDNFDQAFFSWLQSILEPELTKERVEAERPIIQAELAGYRDDPPARLSQLLLENMYRAHPVRNDIGGTSQSVDQIQAADLELAHRLFYAPGQLSLTLAGDLDLTGLLEQLDRYLAGLAWEKNRSRMLAVPEPGLPWSHGGQEQMDLAVPLFLLGCKGEPDAAADSLARLTRQRTAALVLDTLLSPAAALSDTLYQEGLINGSFSYFYAAELDFMFLAAGGEAQDPEQAALRLQEGLVKATAAGLDRELFSAQKKAALGSVLRLADSAARSGLAQARLNLLGLDIFDYVPVYAKIDFDKALQQFSCLADPARYVTALIKPRR